LKITAIEIKNFKFHHSLKFDMQSANCLIYGENGTGKSSIYYALYSVLYALKDKSIANKTVVVTDKYKNFKYPTEDLGVFVKFKNGQILKRIDENMENLDLLENDEWLGGGLLNTTGIPTIYFANEKILSRIAVEDFFNYLKGELSIHFAELSQITDSYEEFKTKLKRIINIDDTIIQDKLRADRLCELYIKKLIPWSNINKIIKDNLQEDFTINYKFKSSEISGDKEFLNPKIEIYMNGIDQSISLFSNESKIKLIGIAIYFALAKKYETQNKLKLLVLDDFLTSLDMANRKLIIQYILDAFQDYQKIILTHNIQFYNLITKLIQIKKKIEMWDFKTIYLKTFSDTNKAVLVDDTRDYIKIAKDALDAYDLEKCGNNLRKEFEYIMTSFEKLLQIGRVEELNNVLQYFKEKDKIILDVQETLELSKKIQGTLHNDNIDDSRKVTIIGKQLTQIKPKEIKDLKNLLYEVNFYKDIILNATSHDDREKEKYRKEFKKIIEVVEKLTNQLDSIGKNE